MSKKIHAEQTRIKKIIIGIIGILFLFYLVSCNSTEDTSPEDVLPLPKATPPSAVEGLRVIFSTDNQAMLSWTAPTNTGTVYGTNATLSGYLVKYKTADSEFIEIDEKSEGVRLAEALTGSSTNATVIGLSPSTSYIFLIAAVNSGNAVGLDADTPTVEQTTAVASPGNLRQTQCAKTTEVGLAWDTSPGATSYKLYRGGSEITSITTNSYTDTGLTAGNRYTYTVQACSTNGCSGDSDSLTITTINDQDKNLKNLIDSEKIPVDLNDYDERSREIFSRYNRDTSIVAKYLKPGGSGDGSSSDKAAGNLGEVLEGITDAAADRVYAVFVTGGSYQAEEPMAMKNHVAIIGGVGACLTASDTVTFLDGGGSYQVFNNDNNNLTNTALLYGVTITDGKADQGGGMRNHNSSPSLVRVIFSGNTADQGGGMFNTWDSAPSLEGVTFSGNTARFGGGMHNTWDSTPSLEGVTFFGNSADFGGGMHNTWGSTPSLEGVTFFGNSADFGGGIYNIYSSSPRLEGITFSNNTANQGGGMFNSDSFPNLEGVTFSENIADEGGGIYNNGSSPSLVGVAFSRNTADNRGGGMYNYNSSPNLEGVAFSGNTADEGGGMYNHNWSSPSLVRVTFSNNTANLDGGGVVNEQSSSSLEEVTFSGNTADNRGGGMYIWGQTTLSSSLVGVTFSGNTADEGGGIYNISGSFLSLEGVTFSGNTASQSGGGMYNTFSPDLVGVTFSGNTASNGGGMYNTRLYDTSSPDLVGVTFSGNTASQSGGGMYNWKSSPILVGVTFSENTASQSGGGIYNNNNDEIGPLVINGIFWGNTANSGAEIYFYNDSTNQENLRIYSSIVEAGTGNLISGETNTSVNQGGFVSGGGSASVVISFSNIIADDPGLDPLADNGGSVWTHAISSTSPAVNQGLYMRRKWGTFYYSANNADWYTEPDLTMSDTPPADAKDLTTDATGYTFTDRPDLGAYEAR